MEILTNFPGGNIDIVEFGDNVIRVRPQLRDTEGDWFYWAFHVTGAAGLTLTFDFSPYNYVGYHGPAVSRDLKEWRWAGGGNENLSSFTYTFGEDEDSVYFAHDMLYGMERFYSFAERLGLKLNHLCISEKGRDVPIIHLGEGEELILLTARHHSCESTGSYVLEGVIEELYKSPLPGCRVVAIPFVDVDGVVEGDQGKNRIPHDHNRDYPEGSIYASVRGIKDIVKNNKTLYALDFHAPWHLGGRNDKVFIVRARQKDMEKYIRFGELFEKEVGEKSMKYSAKDDIDPGVEWNSGQSGINCSFSSFCAESQGVNLAFSLETTYFGSKDDVVGQDKLIETGRAFARALAKYHLNR